MGIIKMIGIDLFDEFASQHIIALLCVDVVLDLFDVDAIPIQ